LASVEAAAAIVSLGRRPGEFDGGMGEIGSCAGDRIICGGDGFVERGCRADQRGLVARSAARQTFGVGEQSDDARPDLGFDCFGVTYAALAVVVEVVVAAGAEILAAVGALVEQAVAGTAAGGGDASAAEKLEVARGGRLAGTRDTSNRSLEFQFDATRARTLLWMLG
jgi:hypothetical protein